jgi:biotin carboxylase
MSNWFVLVESNTTGSGRLFCTAARELGLRPVLLARDRLRYRYLEADGIDSRILDTSSRPAIQQACARLGAVAAVTSSSEYFVAIASEVARSLGLPHPDPAAVQSCRNKGIQRSTLRAAGLPGPDFAVAGTAEQAVAAALRIGLPVVVKPTAGSGSIGVRRCDDAGQVGDAATWILAEPAVAGLAAQNGVLVEQYLAGPEYSVETFDDQVVGITAKRLGREPYFVEIGHDFPAVLGAGQQAAMAAAAIAALRALGLGWGPAHVELRWTGSGPRLIEVNPRLAGGMIPRIVAEATGIDLIRQSVARAAGRSAVPRPRRNRAASIRFLVAGSAGRLTEVTGLSQARQEPGVLEAVLTGVLGQQLLLRNSFQDRLGYVIAAGQDGRSAALAADAGLARIEARIVPASPAGRGSS